MGLYLLGIILPPCILAIAIFVYRVSGEQRGWKPTFFLIWASGFMLLAWLYCGGSLWNYYAARRAMQRGDYSIAEGTVGAFIQGGDHKIESFIVGGRSFHYGCCGGKSETFTSDYNPDAQYIHEGTRARITYRDDAILKVEVE